MSNYTDFSGNFWDSVEWVFQDCTQREENLKGSVKRDFSVLFFIYLDRYEVPNRAGSGLSLFIPWRASVGSPQTINPPEGNNSRIPYSEGSLPPKHNFLKFKHENFIKMKNKLDPALLSPSNLSNEIKKGYRYLMRLSL
jgi:hypothetical protein